MAELSVLIARYKRDTLSNARIASAALSTKVITRTPVDTGKARRSWTPAINRFDSSNSGGNVASVVNSMQIGDRFTLVSSLPYIRPLEYGHSAQAPGGMLRVSVAEWDSIVDQAFR